MAEASRGTAHRLGPGGSAGLPGPVGVVRSAGTPPHPRTPYLVTGTRKPEVGPRGNEALAQPSTLAHRKA